MELVERTSVDSDLSVLNSEIIWKYNGVPEKYIIRSKEDISTTKKRAISDPSFFKPLKRKISFGGLVIYLQKKTEFIKLWKEFGLIRESQDEWNNVIEIVNEIHDDVESEYKLLFSQISKNRHYRGFITNIKLTLIADTSVDVSEFNTYLISQIDWLMEKEEAVIDEVYLLMNDNPIPSKLVRYKSDTGMKLTNKNGDMIDNLKLLVNNISSWAIYFCPPDNQTRRLTESKEESVS